MSSSQPVYSYDHPRPAVSVDLVVLASLETQPRVLLIRRKEPPFQNDWALPGGFLKMDETLETAARRELWEETALEVSELEQIGAFSAVDRDPRGRVITVAFRVVLAGSDLPVVRAGDDARDAQWFDWEALPPLAFDHAQILAAGWQRPTPLERSRR